MVKITAPFPCRVAFAGGVPSLLSEHHCESWVHPGPTEK
ncbi:hypothetical protein LEMLEM_LOCUS25808 [Lemmus lemmus]